MDAEWNGIADAGKMADTNAGVADAGERRPNRDSMFLSARLWIGPEDAGDVRIRNLSERGLMAELAQSLEPGTEIAVELRGVGRVSGRVAWSAAGRIGVALDHEIDPTMARKPVVIRPTIAPATGYVPKRPGRR
jgi:hypothetical protein